MSQVFRRYRQVKIVSQGNSREPQVQGMEEIYCNGQRQVRYWGEPKYLEPQDFADSSLFDLMHPSLPEWPLFPINESIDWMNTKNRRRASNYTDPNEVVVESKVTRQFAGSKALQKIQRALTRGTKKVQRRFRNLPSAMKAAWQELNR